MHSCLLILLMSNSAIIHQYTKISFWDQLHNYEILCMHEIGNFKFPHNVHQGYSIKNLKVDLQIYIALIIISGTVERSF